MKNNKSHPAYNVQERFGNIKVIDFDTHGNLSGLLNILRKDFNIDKITIQTNGTFNATWVRDSLINEVSIVIAPMLIGGSDTQSLIGGESLHTFEDLTKIKALELIECNQLDNSFLHLRYTVIHPTLIEK